jgi:spore germination cell wall hydrolase CwlJ-like protein
MCIGLWTGTQTGGSSPGDQYFVAPRIRPTAHEFGLMKNFVRTAGAAALGLISLAAIAAAGPGKPVFASELPDSGASLLPEAVRSAAEQETTSAQYSLIPWPEANEQSADLPVQRASSLSDLVSRNLSTLTSGQAHECLAIGVYFESKGEPLDGQLAVAQTIINRTKSGRFPASICGVVTQPSQFSFVRGGRLPEPARGSLQWKQAVAIASIAQQGAWKSSASNALFFHARHVAPGWRLTRLASVGNHIFYR